jgi:DNA-directed RNA polymerase specialized sigma24 family protein
VDNTPKKTTPNKRKTRVQEVIPGKMTWQILERLLNNYWEWKEIYRTSGNPELLLNNGVTVNIHDILDGIEKLPPRQKQAVVLSCLENRKEVEVARIMGFTKWSSQVGMYKRKALSQVCNKINKLNEIENRIINEK